MPRQTIPRRLLTVPQVAELTGLSYQGVLRRVRGEVLPRLPAVRLGKHVRVDPDQLVRWIDQQREELPRDDAA